MHKESDNKIKQIKGIGFSELEIGCMEGINEIEIEIDTEDSFRIRLENESYCEH